MPGRRLLRDRLLEALKADGDPLTVDDLYRAISGDGYVNYQTVQWTLKKMTEEGVLTREKEYGGFGQRYIYIPTRRLNREVSARLHNGPAETCGIMKATPN